MDLRRQETGERWHILAGQQKAREPRIRGKKFRMPSKCCLSQGCRRKRLMWKSRGGGILPLGAFLRKFLLELLHGL